MTARRRLEPDEEVRSIGVFLSNLQRRAADLAAYVPTETQGPADGND